MTSNRKTIALNRRARFDYALEDFFEAGIVLTGSEVKSLRNGRANIQDAHASHDGGEIFLRNANIEPWKSAGAFNHEPTRPRKLLLKEREIRKLVGALERKGYTLVPVSMYFNHRGLVKVEIALGKGKTKVDKRHTQKDRDWQRDKSRIIKSYNR